MFGVSMASSEITLEAVSSISAIAAAEWDACANPDGSNGASKPYYNPFISHAFFAAAEASGSATPRTGWGARHLIAKLDDVLDHMEETAHRFEVFRLEKPTAAAVSLARIIMDCTVHLQDAIRLCRNLQKPDEIHARLLEITRLENEADRIYRETESELFKNPPDILTLIKWRELYSWLEETVDACRAVAQVISEIIIKGS